MASMKQPVGGCSALAWPGQARDNQPWKPLAGGCRVVDDGVVVAASALLPQTGFDGTALA
ncbi:MAG: hypothetical protein JWR07_1584 [Nevskia sp.]|nr:hypothetical protein [Nevskia sp.]